MMDLSDVAEIMRSDNLPLWKLMRKTGRASFDFVGKNYSTGQSRENLNVEDSIAELERRVALISKKNPRSIFKIELRAYPNANHADTIPVFEFKYFDEAEGDIYDGLRGVSYDDEWLQKYVDQKFREKEELEKTKKIREELEHEKKLLEEKKREYDDELQKFKSKSYLVEQSFASALGKIGASALAKINPALGAIVSQTVPEMTLAGLDSVEIENEISFIVEYINDNYKKGKINSLDLREIYNFAKNIVDENT